MRSWKPSASSSTWLTMRPRMTGPRGCSSSTRGSRLRVKPSGTSAKSGRHKLQSAHRAKLKSNTALSIFVTHPQPDGELSLSVPGSDPVVSELFHSGARFACPARQTQQRPNQFMRRFLPTVTSPIWLPLALSISVSVSSAAPATSEELSGANDSRAAGTSAPPSTLPVVSAVPQSKSVELLLQLQDQPQQAVAEGRGATALVRKATSPASAPVTSGAADNQAAADSSPLSALKNSMLRGAVPRQSESSAQPSALPPGMTERSGLTGQPGVTLQRRESGESVLSHPLIRYIRENRMTVISICVAVLAGIWLTATFSMRRSR